MDSVISPPSARPSQSEKSGQGDGRLGNIVSHGYRPIDTVRLTKLGIPHEWIPVPGSPHNHDQLLQFQTFDTMAFYGKVFGGLNSRPDR
jgi:hypothetical protein